VSSRNGARAAAPWTPGPLERRWWDTFLASFKRYAEREAMATLPAATAEVTVDASPEEAFRIFTEEIGLWWRRGTPYWNDRERGLSVRIEPGVGGRFVEVYDLEEGSGFEVGRVTAWEPGRRLALTWTQVGWPQGVATDLEVTFEAVGGGTRVRLEQTGFERVGAEAARFLEGYAMGWKQVLGWFAARANAPSG
jgi:uncharacterized protein YndB with AHSA1/START domain